MMHVLGGVILFIFFGLFIFLFIHDKHDAYLETLLTSFLCSLIALAILIIGFITMFGIATGSCLLITGQMCT